MFLFCDTAVMRASHCLWNECFRRMHHRDNSKLIIFFLFVCFCVFFVLSQWIVYRSSLGRILMQITPELLFFFLINKDYFVMLFVLGGYLFFENPKNSAALGEKERERESSSAEPGSQPQKTKLTNTKNDSKNYPFFKVNKLLFLCQSRWGVTKEL